MELAVLERNETIERGGLGNRRSRSCLLVEQQAMAAEPIGVEQDRLRGCAQVARKLAEAAAGDEPVEHGQHETGPPQPVGDVEGLRAEASTTVPAAEPLDAVRGRVTVEVTVTDPVPALAVRMELAAGIRAMRGHLGGRCDHHVA